MFFPVTNLISHIKKQYILMGFIERDISICCNLIIHLKGVNPFDIVNYVF